MDSGNGVLHYTVGQTGILWDPFFSVPLATISVSAPTFSVTDSDGDTPQYGYFATFTVSMTDIAPAATQDNIMPNSDDFYVQTADGRLFGNGGQPSVLPGNGFWAELPNDLGSSPNGQVDINLLPGQSLTGTVTIDVPDQHGVLVYQGSDDGAVDGSWAF